MSDTTNPVGDPRPITAQKDHAFEQPGAPQEFAKFEDLARNLVNVPKEEVDEKREKSD